MPNEYKIREFCGNARTKSAGVCNLPVAVLAAFLSGVLVLCGQGAFALMAPELIPHAKRIPVVRIVRNLERMAAEKPKDGEIQYHLARVHVVAYSSKSNVVRSEEGWDATEEHSDELRADEQFVQAQKVEKPVDEIAANEARAHLDKAVEHYSKAIQLGARQFYVYLGLGWCHQELGRVDAAKESYRAAVAVAFEWATTDKSYKSVKYFDSEDKRAYAREAISYLRRLLDETRDAAEIAKLRSYEEQVRQEFVSVTPILFGLESDAPLDDLVQPEAAVTFDLDGSGTRRQWGWISPKAAWLVFDPAGEGNITSGVQFFGSTTFISFWDNGFEALAALDDDGDGVISGSEREGLALWQDLNVNGVSEPGEVRGIASWGISSLSCAYHTEPGGIPTSAGGVRMTDGTSRTMYDWILASKDSEVRR